jgi:hypothetical protein
LRAPAIKGLLQSGALQLSLLFDQRDMASITSLRSLGSSSWLTAQSTANSSLVRGGENPCFPGKKQGNLLVAMALEHHCLASSLVFSAP